MKHSITLALLAIFGCGSAAAESRFYAGMGIGASKIERDGPSASFTDNFVTGAIYDAGTGAQIDSISEDVTISPNTDLSDSDTTFKAFVGWRPLKWIGVEGGWTYLGEPDGTSPAGNRSLNNNRYPQPAPPGQFIPGNIGSPPPPDGPGFIVDEDAQYTNETELKGWFVNAIGFLPINEQWEVFAKLGVFFWESDYSVENRVLVNGSPNGLLQNPTLLPAILEQDDDNGEDLFGGFGINFTPTEIVTLRAEVDYYDVLDDVMTVNFSAVYNFQ